MVYKCALPAKNNYNSLSRRTCPSIRNNSNMAGCLPLQPHCCPQLADKNLRWSWRDQPPIRQLQGPGRYKDQPPVAPNPQKFAVIGTQIKVFDGFSAPGVCSTVSSSQSHNLTWRQHVLPLEVPNLVLLHCRKRSICRRLTWESCQVNVAYIILTPTAQLEHSSRQPQIIPTLWYIYIYILYAIYLRASVSLKLLLVLPRITRRIFFQRQLFEGIAQTPQNPKSIPWMPSTVYLLIISLLIASYHIHW